MDSWDEWKLSRETEDRLKVILPKLDLENSREYSNVFRNLLNYGSSVILNNSFDQMAVDSNEDSKEEILSLIKESLETNTIFPESKFAGLSYSNLNTILLRVKEIINELDFPTFCTFLIHWNNTVLVEDSLRLVVLPKLKEKQEASACVIFAIKDLVLNKPVETIHQVLAPLLTDESLIFSDIELLNEVIPALPSELKDYLITILCEKKNFQENDCLLLQTLLKDLSPNGISSITNCIYKFSNEFIKSQVFGKFLVCFCKNLQQVRNKNLLVEAIDQHQTLFKKQALKYLESVEEFQI